MNEIIIASIGYILGAIVATGSCLLGYHWGTKGQTRQLTFEDYGYDTQAVLDYIQELAYLQAEREGIKEG